MKVNQIDLIHFYIFSFENDVNQIYLIHYELLILMKKVINDIILKI